MIREKSLRLALVLAVSASVVRGADERPRLRPQPAESRNAKSGPPVGTRLPGFELTDSAGQRQTFDSLRGPKGAVLLFVRSADWSRPCRDQILDLDKHEGEFRRKGFGVAAISYDSVAVLRAFAEKDRVSAKMLSDEGSQTIRALGLLNPNYEAGSREYGTAFPGTLVVDEHGTITAKYFDDDFSERFTASAILMHEAQGEGAGKTVIDTPQAVITLSASDIAVMPGSRIAVAMEIDPKPKMHVFAPGMPGLIPLEWQMGASKGWAAFPVTYPAGRFSHLSAVNENGPSYDRHVRIVRDVVIGQGAELGLATRVDNEGKRVAPVEGAVRFEACDDKDAYPARVVYLRWNITVLEP